MGLCLNCGKRPALLALTGLALGLWWLSRTTDYVEIVYADVDLPKWEPLPTQPISEPREKDG